LASPTRACAHKPIDDKAEEGQDTYGEGGSSGGGGCSGEGKCRHGKQRCKCRECRGEGQAATGEGKGREEPELQGREKRARTKQPRKKCPHNRQRNLCKNCGGASICEHNRVRSACKDCCLGAAEMGRATRRELALGLRSAEGVKGCLLPT